MFSAYDVAKYLLSLVQEDEGDLMTNLKLQKLLYYVQGFHLAIFDKPLFLERIEAWIHGPVVPAIYHEYKGFGRDRIPHPSDLPADILDEQTRELIDEVYDVYGQFSAVALRNMTHVEPPWVNTASGAVIPLDSLKAFFKTRVVGNDGEETESP